MGPVSGDARADWVFIAEGGAIAMLDLEGVDESTTGNPMTDELRTRRFKVGDLGVKPADLLLDPDADLVGQEYGLNAPTRGDLLYIAGGIMGLWAMRIETGPSGTNPVVRIDDSGNMTPSTQFSLRFCNQLATASIGGTPYLLATFGRSEGKSVLRGYKLSRLRDLLDASLYTSGFPPNYVVGEGTGVELAPDFQVPLKNRVGFPYVSSSDTHSEAFPLGIAVDQISAQACAVYIAMGAHWVYRSDLAFANGLVTQSAVVMGPVFGDGSTYATQHSMYGNFDYRDLSRRVEFDTVTRSEPPIFTDVAVQRDSNGHYLYCAVDHLNWLRFDLSQAFSATMAIDHHEGEPYEVVAEASWHGHQGVSAVSSYGASSGQWVVRAEDFPPTDDGPGGEVHGWDGSFARRLELVTPPGLDAHLVVTSSYVPFLGAPGNVTPVPPFNHTFTHKGGVDFAASLHIGMRGLSLPPPTPAWVRLKLPATIVYDTTALGNALNGKGYIAAGGQSLFVPPEQPDLDPPALRIVHNAMLTHIENGTVPSHPVATGPNQETCLSYYGIGALNQPDGFGDPVFFRDAASPSAKGRFNNGIGFNVVDPRILVSAHNDSAPRQDGILWARPTTTAGNPDVILGPLGTSPTSLGDDRRMETGLISSPNNQWSSEDHYPSSVAASAVLPQGADPAEYRFHYIVGEGKAKLDPLSMTEAAADSWSIAMHYVKIAASGLPFPPAADFVWQRVVDQPVDRFSRAGRAGTYMNGVTTTPAFEAWATAQGGSNPTSYLFFQRAGSPEGLVAVDRDEVLAHADTFWFPPPASGPGDFFPRQRFTPWPTTGSVNNQLVLNTHPEWNPIPDGVSGSASNHWWTVISPITHQGATSTWPPILLEYPETLYQGQGAEQTEWILAVPCFTLANPHNVPWNNAGGTALDIAGTSGGYNLDTQFEGWMNAAAANAEVEHLVTHYSHGLVQFWRWTDRPTETEQTTPRGMSDLPFIVLPTPQSSAWRLDMAHVGEDETEQMLLFVADFSGHLYVYDVTDLPFTARNPGGYGSPIASWDVPAPLYEKIGLNLRAMAVDVISDSLIEIYCGIPSYGIAVVPLERNPTTGIWDFDTDDIERIETPGDVHDLSLRPSVHGLPKMLLVSDGPGGFRIYGQEVQ